MQNIEKRLDNIDGNLVVAQQNINKLGSIFGGIRNYFSPPKSAFHKSASQPQISDANKKKAATSATTTTNRATNARDDTDTYFGKRRGDMDDVERETEDGLRTFFLFALQWIIISSDFLEDIHEGVGRLKMLALHMNQELEDQKPLTERLGGKMDRLTGDVAKKNKEMKAIALR